MTTLLKCYQCSRVPQRTAHRRRTCCWAAWRYSWCSCSRCRGSRTQWTRPGRQSQATAGRYGTRRSHRPAPCRPPSNGSDSNWSHTETPRTPPHGPPRDPCTGLSPGEPDAPRAPVLRAGRERIMLGISKITSRSHTSVLVCVRYLSR